MLCAVLLLQHNTLYIVAGKYFHYAHQVFFCVLLLLWVCLGFMPRDVAFISGFRRSSFRATTSLHRCRVARSLARFVPHPDRSHRLFDQFYYCVIIDAVLRPCVLFSNSGSRSACTRNLGTASVPTPPPSPAAPYSKSWQSLQSIYTNYELVRCNGTATRHAQGKRRQRGRSSTTRQRFNHISKHKFNQTCAKMKR